MQLQQSTRQEGTTIAVTWWEVARDLFSRTTRHVPRFPPQSMLMRVTTRCTWAQTRSLLCPTRTRRQLFRDGGPPGNEKTTISITALMISKRRRDLAAMKFVALLRMHTNIAFKRVSLKALKEGHLMPKVTIRQLFIEVRCNRRIRAIWLRRVRTIICLI